MIENLLFLYAEGFDKHPTGRKIFDLDGFYALHT
jgi:hypothetical protein